ncbi:hypothetical protein [Draconibacterium sediminis]|uniref:hypothetical protein n=1 Tax=Draconibacterium sediminis TaxID=1544798 RepID=UPI0026EFC25F|nr:hypothetical protein [Draconibacterium sediminis]
MESTNDFNLNSALDCWIEVNCSKEDMTPSSIVEIRDHMLLTIEELVEEKDLTTEEAFAVMKVRFGNSDDWAEEMQIMNDDNFQLRKVVFLFGGVLVYFILYHFIIATAELLYFWLDYYNNQPAEFNILRIQQYIITCYFLTSGGIVTLFFMEKKIISFLSRVKIKPLIILVLFFLLLVLFILGRYLKYEIGNQFGGHTRENYKFLKSFSDLSYIYPVIFGLGFIMLFFRYRKRFFVK